MAPGYSGLRSIGDIGILDNNQLANGPGLEHISVFTGCTNSGQRKDWGHKLQAASLTGLKLYVMGYYRRIKLC